MEENPVRRFSEKDVFEMPQYEYRCLICDQATTLVRKMADMDSPAACGCCGALMQRNAVNSFAVMTHARYANYSSPIDSDSSPTDGGSMQFGRSHNITIKDCSIDSCGAGVVLNGVDGVHIDGLTVSNTQGPPITLTDSTSVSLDRIKLKNTKGRGVEAERSEITRLGKIEYEE